MEIIPGLNDSGTSTRKSAEQIAFEAMKQAFVEMSDVLKTRESSLAITNLEQAMMWINKDRANKGQLKGSETHV